MNGCVSGTWNMNFYEVAIFYKVSEPSSVRVNSVFHVFGRMFEQIYARVFLPGKRVCVIYFSEVWLCARDSSFQILWIDRNSSK